MTNRSLEIILMIKYSLEMNRSRTRNMPINWSYFSNRTKLLEVTTTVTWADRKSHAGDGWIFRRWCCRRSMRRHSQPDHAAAKAATTAKWRRPVGNPWPHSAPPAAACRTLPLNTLPAESTSNLTDYVIQNSFISLFDLIILADNKTNRQKK